MNLFNRRSVRRTTLICFGFGSVLVGLFVAYYGAEPRLYWLLFVLFLFPLMYKKKYAAFGACVLVGLMIGIWRGNMMFKELQKYNTLFGKVVLVRGIVADDSGFNESHGVTEFHLNTLRTESTELPGRIQISTREKSAIARGDELEVTGKLKPSKGTSRQGTLGSAKIKIIHKNKSWIEDLRTEFFQSLKNAIPEPRSNLGLGYLVGVRVNIPKDLSDQLALVGLTHIVAVSGYNLTIIVQAVRRMIGKRSAYQSVVFSGLLILGFLIITGGSAPINRAAVVCGFSLLGWYFGRTIKASVLLLLSGALTAFASPLYIWGDPGWYLSFLAFAGVLIIAPLFTKRFFRKKPPGTILQILLETLGAQLCTIPYTLYLFGGASVIAPLANVVVLPLVPFIMLAVFVTGIVGIFLPFVALWIGVVPSSLLTLQMWCIEKMSTIPGAHADTKISLQIMLLLFLVIVGAAVYLEKSIARRVSAERLVKNEDMV